MKPGLTNTIGLEKTKVIIVGSVIHKWPERPEFVLAKFLVTPASDDAGKNNSNALFDAKMKYLKRLKLV